MCINSRRAISFCPGALVANYPNLSPQAGHGLRLTSSIGAKYVPFAKAYCWYVRPKTWTVSVKDSSRGTVPSLQGPLVLPLARCRGGVPDSGSIVSPGTGLDGVGCLTDSYKRGEGYSSARNRPRRVGKGPIKDNSGHFPMTRKLCGTRGVAPAHPYMRPSCSKSLRTTRKGSGQSKRALRGIPWFVSPAMPDTAGFLGRGWQAGSGGSLCVGQLGLACDGERPRPARGCCQPWLQRRGARLC